MAMATTKGTLIKNGWEVPAPRVVRSRVRPPTHDGCLANETYLGSNAVPPARYDTVVHQHFDAVGPAVGKEVGAVRLRRTEHRDHSGQRGLRAGTHVHRLGSEPDGIDANLPRLLGLQRHLLNTTITMSV